MADWNYPQLTDTELDYTNNLKERDIDLAKQFDGTGTNLPDGTIRWNSSTSRWEKLVSGVWDVLASIYEITARNAVNSDTVDGFHATTTPEASKIVVSEGDGKINSGWLDPSDIQSMAFPSGTKMFFASSLPPGWTLDTTFHDKVIRVVNDSTLVGQSGGSWVITGMNSAGGHSHGMTSAGYHQHAAPLGEYTYAEQIYEGGASYYIRTNNLIIEDSWGYDTVTMSGWWIDGLSRQNASSAPPETDTATVKRPKTAGAGSHTHTIYSAGSHIHTFDGSWRPAYLNVILGVKS